MNPGFLEFLSQDSVLYLFEGARRAHNWKRDLVEHAFDLADTPLRVRNTVDRMALDRVVIQYHLEHTGVVDINPERYLLRVGKFLEVGSW